MKLQCKPLISVVIKGFDLHWLEVNRVLGSLLEVT